MVSVELAKGMCTVHRRAVIETEVDELLIQQNAYAICHLFGGFAGLMAWGRNAWEW
jgi:hypothetical protein